MIILNDTKDINIKKSEKRKEKFKHLDLRDIKYDYLFERYIF